MNIVFLALERLISNAVMVETNDDSKKTAILFNIWRGVGMELYAGEQVFSPIFIMKRSKKNEIVKLWKFSL